MHSTDRFADQWNADYHDYYDKLRLYRLISVAFEAVRYVSEAHVE